jgi:hypothetical protein
MQATTLGFYNRGSGSSRAIDRRVSLAFLAIRLEMQWFTSLENLGILPESFLRCPLADLVPLLWSLAFRESSFSLVWLTCSPEFIFSIRINSKVLDAKIDTKNSFGIVRRLFGYSDHNAKAKIPLKEITSACPLTLSIRVFW